MGTINVQLLTIPSATIVPNSFIDEDMLSGNELQLKVYLYLLRHANCENAINVSLMADHFNETEKDIQRAIQFWVKKGLLKLGEVQATDSLTEATKQVELKQAKPVKAEDTKVPSTIAPLPGNKEKAALDLAKERPHFSRDEFDTLTASDAFNNLSFLAETYIARTLTKADLESLLFIREYLKFSDDLLEYLLEYCAERGKKSMKYIEATARSWASDGIHSPEQAKENVSKYSKKIYSIMSALGKNGTPASSEVDYINRWYSEYSFEPDVILEACKRTVLATDNNRFAYADKILQSWHGQGIHHSSDIPKADANYQKKNYNNNTSKHAPAYVHNNPFLQHQQGSVDYAALEKQLL